MTLIRKQCPFKAICDSSLPFIQSRGFESPPIRQLSVYAGLRVFRGVKNGKVGSRV
jgi:hypothetical protein